MSGEPLHRFDLSTNTWVRVSGCKKNIPSSLFFTVKSAFKKNTQKKEHSSAARPSRSRISSISVGPDMLEAYLCTYFTRGGGDGNRPAWKHQVREKKNSHWLQTFLNVAASRSRCPRLVAPPPRHQHQTLIQPSLLCFHLMCHRLLLIWAFADGGKGQRELASQLMDYLTGSISLCLCQRFSTDVQIYVKIFNRYV